MPFNTQYLVRYHSLVFSLAYFISVINELNYKSNCLSVLRLWWFNTCCMPACDERCRRTYSYYYITVVNSVRSAPTEGASEGGEGGRCVKHVMCVVYNGEYYK